MFIIMLVNINKQLIEKKINEKIIPFSFRVNCTGERYKLSYFYVLYFDKL